jgi:hypothetical protein
MTRRARYPRGSWALLLCLALPLQAQAANIGRVPKLNPKVGGVTGAAGANLGAASLSSVNLQLSAPTLSGTHLPAAGNPQLLPQSAVQGSLNQVPAAAAAENQPAAQSPFPQKKKKTFGRRQPGTLPVSDATGGNSETAVPDVGDADFREGLQQVQEGTRDIGAGLSDGDTLGAVDSGRGTFDGAVEEESLGEQVLGYFGWGKPTPKPAPTRLKAPIEVGGPQVPNLPRDLRVRTRMQTGSMHENIYLGNSDGQEVVVKINAKANESTVHRAMMEVELPSNVRIPALLGANEATEGVYGDIGGDGVIAREGVQGFDQSLQYGRHVIVTEKLLGDYDSLHPIITFKKAPKHPILESDWAGLIEAFRRLHARGIGHGDLQNYTNIRMAQTSTGRTYFAIIDPGDGTIRGKIDRQDIIRVDRAYLGGIERELRERGLIVADPVEEPAAVESAAGEQTSGRGQNGAIELLGGLQEQLGAADKFSAVAKNPKALRRVTQALEKMGALKKNKNDGPTPERAQPFIRSYKDSILNAAQKYLEGKGLNAKDVISTGSTLHGFLGMMFSGRIEATNPYAGEKNESPEYWAAQGIDTASNYAALRGVPRGEPGVLVIMHSPDGSLRVVAGETLNRQPTVAGDFLAVVIGNGSESVIIEKPFLDALASSGVNWRRDVERDARRGGETKLTEWADYSDIFHP